MLGVGVGSGSYAPNELLVSFAPGASATTKAAALSTIGAKTIETIRTQAMDASGATDLVRVTIGNGLSPDKAMEIVSKRPGVIYAEPNYQYTAYAVSNDDYYVNTYLWGMYGNETDPMNQFGSQAGEVWAGPGYVGSSKVITGVIDTGIDYTHPDLYQNVWLNQTEIPSTLRPYLTDIDTDGLITFRDLNHFSNFGLVNERSDDGNGYIDAGDLLADSRWVDGVDGNGIKGTANGYTDDLIGWNFVSNNNNPFDDNGHGTHVSGTIGATGGNDLGVAGVSWNTQMVGLKFLAKDGSGYTSNAVKAIDYFTGMKAAYASLGLSSDAFDFAATNNSWGGGFRSQALYDAIVRGAKADILFVAAAGNNGRNNDSSANWPSNYDTKKAAGYDAVIAVAAIDQWGYLASFSNYGDKTVDLAAPGVGIWSTVPGVGYKSYNGTSMATPHVTGAVALYTSVYGSKTASQIRNDLMSATEWTDGLATKTAWNGRLDISGLDWGIIV